MARQEEARNENLNNIDSSIDLGSQDYDSEDCGDQDYDDQDTDDHDYDDQDSDAGYTWWVNKSGHGMNFDPPRTMQQLKTRRLTMTVDNKVSHCS